MRGRDADAIARDYIERHGLGEEFGHSLGHGIGLEVHEAPRLSKAAEAPLPAWSVVTIEPGVYIRQAALDALPKTAANLELVAKIQAAANQSSLSVSGGAGISVKGADGSPAASPGTFAVLRAARQLL